MGTSLCRRCQKDVPVLADGTLVEHPQTDTPYLLCAGSRTRGNPDAAALAPRQDRDLTAEYGRGRVAFLAN